MVALPRRSWRPEHPAPISRLNDGQTPRIAGGSIAAAKPGAAPLVAALRHLRGDRAATTAVFLACGLGIGAWAASIPAFKADLHLSDGALSLALLAFAVGAVISMPLVGMLVPRTGSARATRVAALLFAASLLLPTVAASLPALAAATCAMGVAMGAVDVAMNAHANLVEARRGRPIMSSFHAAFSTGGLLGAAMGGVLGGRPVALVVAAVAAALLAGLGWTALRERAAPADAGPALLLPSRATLTLCVASLLCLLCEGAMADWSGVYLRTVANAAHGTEASGYAAFAAAMVVGRFAGDRVVHALGHVRVVAAGGALASLGLVLAAAWPLPVPAATGFALVGLGLSNVVPALFSAAGRLSASAAAGVAMAATAGYAGFLTGPVAVGAIAQSAGLRTAMALLALCAVAIALLAGAVRGAETPH